MLGPRREIILLDLETASVRGAREVSVPWII